MKDFYVPKASGPIVEMGNHRGYVNVRSETTVGGFSMSHVQVDADGGVPPHIHRREDEAFYVLEGLFEFIVGADAFIAGPDDTVVGPRDVMHTWRCISPEGGRVLIFFTPGANMEAFAFGFAQKVSEFAVAGPAAMAAFAAQYGIEMLPPHFETLPSQ
ncbi:MAG: cupin domain-containing protein [Akkermansiaceae bacterium]|nr:cupin domain-containing protein [Armatimonadota bacterium]